MAVEGNGNSPAQRIQEITNTKNSARDIIRETKLARIVYEARVGRDFWQESTGAISNGDEISRQWFREFGNA